MTLIIIHDDDRILLGMKKRGFGTGRWNGFGGKVLEGESIEDAARRELKEEAGIDANDLVHRGTLNFSFENNPDLKEDIETHLFFLPEYSGVPEESEEMKPQWFAHHEIPYNEMWNDDKFWLPLFLQGKNIRGHFHFDSPGSQTTLKQSLESYE